MATIHDGFGSCETVPFDRDDDKYNPQQLALGCVALLLVCGGAGYLGGAFDGSPAEGNPKRSDYLSSPTFLNNNVPTPGTPASNGAASQKLANERVKLQKISQKIHKRQLAMRAQLADMKQRDAAMEAREEAAEAKLMKAQQEVARAEKMSESSMDLQSGTAQLAQCTSKVRELKAEKTKIILDKKRAMMRAALDNAHAKNMQNVNSKQSILEQQKAEAIEMADEKEIDAEEDEEVKKIKNELEKQKKSLESLVNIQKGFQKLNKQKAKDLEADRQDFARIKKRVVGLRKRLVRKLKMLDESKLVKLSDVERLLGTDAKELLEAQTTLVTSNSVLGKSMPEAEDDVTDDAPPKVPPASTKPPPAQPPANNNGKMSFVEKWLARKCDKDWCSHHSGKHSITPGKGWGDAPDDVKGEWWKHHCLDKNAQDNSQCDVDLNGPEVPPPTGDAPPPTAAAKAHPLEQAFLNCDRKFCNMVKEKFAIMPGQNWGSAPKQIQAAWFTRHCHEPAKMNNVKCNSAAAAKSAPVPAPGPTPPPTKGFVAPGSANDDDEAEDYEKDAGAMGGTGNDITSRLIARMRAQGIPTGRI